MNNFRQKNTDKNIIEDNLIFFRKCFFALYLSIFIAGCGFGKGKNMGNDPKKVSEARLFIQKKYPPQAARVFSDFVRSNPNNLATSQTQLAKRLWIECGSLERYYSSKKEFQISFNKGWSQIFGEIDVQSTSNNNSYVTTNAGEIDNTRTNSTTIINAGKISTQNTSNNNSSAITIAEEIDAQSTSNNNSYSTNISSDSGNKAMDQRYLNIIRENLDDILQDRGIVSSKIINCITQGEYGVDNMEEDLESFEYGDSMLINDALDGIDVDSELIYSILLNCMTIIKNTPLAGESQQQGITQSGDSNINSTFPSAGVNTTLATDTNSTYIPAGTPINIPSINSTSVSTDIPTDVFADINSTSVPAGTPSNITGINDARSDSNMRFSMFIEDLNSEFQDGGAVSSKILNLITELNDSNIDPFRVFKTITKSYKKSQNYKTGERSLGTNSTVNTNVEDENENEKKSDDISERELDTRIISSMLPTHNTTSHPEQPITQVLQTNSDAYEYDHTAANNKF